MSVHVIAGTEVELDGDGHMSTPSDWNEELARAIAREEGIDHLTERHWAVIHFMRREFEEKGEVPTIRRLTKESGVESKELYALFPNGPAKKAAKVAGLPKPKGCI
jgi:tRNA 2-thiouridine synthesizing protein E